MKNANNEKTKKKHIEMFITRSIKDMLKYRHDIGAFIGEKEMSTLAERMEIIIDECGIKQTVFAKSVGVTPNYISMIIHGKKELISPTLALLIEYIYGYSHEWILSGEGDKYNREKLKKRIIKKIEDSSYDENQLNELDEFLNRL